MASKTAICPWRAIRRTAPGTVLLSVSERKACRVFSRRFEENPTSSGRLATGRGWANAAAAKRKAARDTGNRKWRSILVSLLLFAFRQKPWQVSAGESAPGRAAPVALRGACNNAASAAHPRGRERRNGV